MNVLELFAGIGGMALGLERAGMRPVGFVEINPWCRRVLARHWPEVPQHDDVRTAIGWWLSEERPRVDIVAGGYPCQTDSVAGPRRGLEDERWIWPEMARLIHAIRPRYVLGENVLGHRTRGLRFVLRDLQRLGYTATAGVLRACEVGAPHPRPRLFIVAHSNSEGRDARRRVEPSGTSAVGTGWWPSEPDVARVDDGIPDRVDRRRALGNSVVPRAAEHLGRLIRAHAEADLSNQVGAA